MSSNILVSSSVSSSAVTAAYSLTATHKKNETAADAIDIGNLDEQSVIVSISDDGAEATNAVSTSFISQGGTISLSEAIDSYVDIVFTRFQLSDELGTVIADSDGTEEQVANYNKWLDGTLLVSAGTYTATATPNTEFTGDIALTINSAERQGTSLEVNSTLTGAHPTEYYNFSLSGTNIKLDFDAGRNSGATRVILYDSNHKIVADSAGNSFQREQYSAITSGTGISAASGNYSIEVTYSNSGDITQNVGYSFRLYSGNTYAAVYKSTVKAQAYDASAKGSVEATKDAQLYELSTYNKIHTDASQAINIGWIQQDKSMLDVYSQLTNDDNTNFYKFTLQQGNNLKFDFSAATENKEGLRVQLMNSTGTFVYADSEGTAEQRTLYEQLTSSTGVQADTGDYIIKITYAGGVKNGDHVYEFGVYSGSTFSAQYKTTASAQTYGNALLANELGGSTAAAAGIAAYLMAQRDDTEGTFASTKLADALKSKF